MFSFISKYPLTEKDKNRYANANFEHLSTFVDGLNERVSIHAAVINDVVLIYYDYTYVSCNINIKKKEIYVLSVFDRFETTDYIKYMCVDNYMENIKEYITKKTFLIGCLE